MQGSRAYGGRRRRERERTLVLASSLSADRSMVTEWEAASLACSLSSSDSGGRVSVIPPPGRRAPASEVRRDLGPEPPSLGVTCSRSPNWL